MTDLSKLSLEQLQQRLEELGAEWHLVEEAIDQRKVAGKQELAQEVRQKIVDAGFDVAEIVALLRVCCLRWNRKFPCLVIM
jgi:hypothetical protein